MALADLPSRGSGHRGRGTYWGWELTASSKMKGDSLRASRGQAPCYALCIHCPANSSAPCDGIGAVVPLPGIRRLSLAHLAQGHTAKGGSSYVGEALAGNS